MVEPKKPAKKDTKQQAVPKAQPAQEKKPAKEQPKKEAVIVIHFSS